MPHCASQQTNMKYVLNIQLNAVKMITFLAFKQMIDIKL